MAVLATALGLYGAAAHIQTTPAKPAAGTSTPGKTGPGNGQAVDAKQYLFAFIYEQNTTQRKQPAKPSTRGLRRSARPQISRRGPQRPHREGDGRAVKLEAAPMPLVLAIAPNSASPPASKQRTSPKLASRMPWSPRHAAMPQGASGPKAHLRLPAEHQHQSQ